MLLTVSGEISPDLDEQIAAGRRPRADYRVMAGAFDADLLDESLARAEHPRIGRLVHRVAGVGPLLAWACWRRRSQYSVIVTDGEQVGLPLALLCRILGRAGVRHAMIVHVVSPKSKVRVVNWARLAPLIDRWLVYCTAQADFIAERFSVAREQIEITPFMVDTEFFSPRAAAAAIEGSSTDPVPPAERPMICAVGLERRDYPTFMDAVDGLDVDVVIAAASPWSKQDDSTEGRSIPANVTVERYSQWELREVYHRCRFSVMPLVEVDFQAGITAILESMAMERAVVCTRTVGQTDTIVDRSQAAAAGTDANGLYVAPGDAAELRMAIVELIDSPEVARRLGAAAREWAIEHAEVDVYAQRIATIVDELRP